MHTSILIHLNCVRIRSTRNISGAGGSAVLASCAARLLLCAEVDDVSRDVYMNGTGLYC